MSTSIQELAETVAELTVPGKGILAADESDGTIAKRFKEVEVVSTAETRRDLPGACSIATSSTSHADLPTAHGARRRAQHQLSFRWAG